jgi:hypothetical protein
MVACSHKWETLRYELEGRAFDSRSGHWDFYRLHPSGTGFESASSRNWYQEYLLRVKAADV